MSGFVFDRIISATQRFVGPFYRKIGRQLYAKGT